MTDFPALADVTLQPNNESFVVSRLPFMKLVYRDLN